MRNGWTGSDTKVPNAEENCQGHPTFRNQPADRTMRLLYSWYHCHLATSPAELSNPHAACHDPHARAAIARRCRQVGTGLHWEGRWNTPAARVTIAHVRPAPESALRPTGISSCPPRLLATPAPGHAASGQGSAPGAAPDAHPHTLRFVFRGRRHLCVALGIFFLRRRCLSGFFFRYCYCV